MFSDSYVLAVLFCLISDDKAMVQWNHKDVRISRVRDVHVIVGAVTIARARLMLFDLLNKLQEHILYCDTV